MKLSELLKESTRKIHQQVEKRVILNIKAIRSDEDYIQFLKAFYAYFSIVEQQIVPFITHDVLPDYTRRRNSSYILADIYELGGTIENLVLAEPPVITNSLQAMAALYVLEGSTIGGPYIVEMLRKTGIKKGFSFFSAYGALTGDMWTIFLDHLNILSEKNTDRMSAFNTAVSTFRNFERVFERQNQEQHTSSN